MSQIKVVIGWSHTGNLTLWGYTTRTFQRHFLCGADTKDEIQRSHTCICAKENKKNVLFNLKEIHFP